MMSDWSQDDHIRAQTFSSLRHLMKGCRNHHGCNTSTTFTVQHSNLNRRERYQILQSRSLAPMHSSEQSASSAAPSSCCRPIKIHNLPRNGFLRLRSVQACIASGRSSAPYSFGLELHRQVWLDLANRLPAVVQHLATTRDFADCRLCNIPLVCKSWARLSRGSSSLWSTCEVGPDPEDLSGEGASRKDL